jgi:pyridoxal phosphate enzyme (YggS family)
VNGGGRREEIARNLAEVRSRIDRACRAAGRHSDDVTLVAVTKTWPADDVRHLAAVGVTDVGENRDQEARRKHDECAGLPLRWHYIGQLQRNKCRSVATYADVVHSVDRLALVDALSRAATAADRTLVTLVQVQLDQPPAAGRGGAVPGEVADVAAAVASSTSLRLGGVMGVAPLDSDPDEAFARLAAVAHDVRSAHPDAGVISAGMSGDLEAAIRHGATHVRVGTALLGHRPSPVG